MIATIVVMIRTVLVRIVPVRIVHRLYKTPPKMIQIDLVLKVFPVPVMVDMDFATIVVSMN